MEVGAKLARTLEAAHGWCISQYAASVARLNPHVRAAVAPVNSGVSIYVGPSPFSFAVGLAMDAPIAEAEINEVEDFFRSRSIPPRIDICPYTDPGLLPILEQRGYTPAEVTSVLAFDLEADLRATKNDHAVLRWAEEQDCDVWVDVVARCFFETDPGERARSRMAALFQVPDSLNVIATVGGSLAGVAGGMIPEDRAVAALFGSAVLPQFRHNRVHQAMIDFRLQRAKELGCRLAVASATPGTVSEHNLTRFGFVPCYHKITYVAPCDQRAASGSR